jgi:benzoyl-CoA reductase subunit C
MADGLFDQFKDWYENRHDYARAWKARTGGQVVATMCTYTAEELLIAAGMLPVRVLGAHEPQNVTEPHIFGMFCPFCRDSLAQGLLGRFDYCEGVTLTQSCIQYRQTFSSWRSNVPSVSGTTTCRCPTTCSRRMPARPTTPSCNPSAPSSRR